MALKNKTLAFLLLYITFSMPVCGTNMVDSLKQIIPRLEGCEKLNTIYDLILLKLGMPESIDYTDMLEQEARRQDNKEFITSALLLKTAYYVENPGFDSLVYYAGLTKAHAQEYGFYEHYFLADNYMIQQYIENGSYELAQFYVKQMLEKARKLNNIEGEMSAYECMASAYLSSKQPQRAIEAIKKAIDLLKKHRPDLNMFLIDYYKLLMQAARDCKDYAGGLVYADGFEGLLIEFEIAQKGADYEKLSTQNYWLALEAYRAMCYACTGQHGKAKASLYKAAAYDQSDIPESQIQELNLSYAHYYHSTKQTDNALSYLEKVILFQRRHAAGSSYIDLEYFKSDMLADKGLYKEAFLLRKQMNLRSDSLNGERFIKQMQEIHTIYQVEKMKTEAMIKETEAMIKETEYRNKLIFILTVAILLLLALTIIMYYYRKKQIAYRELVRKGQQWANILPPTTMDIEGDEGDDIPAAPDEITENSNNFPDEADLLIMRSIEQQLKENKLYSNPQLTLDIFSEMIGVNRYYISKAINRCSGRNFNTYINEYRVKEAILIMSSQVKSNLSIDEIAYKSGFADRSNFYRTFKKATGLTPTSFRNHLGES